MDHLTFDGGGVEELVCARKIFSLWPVFFNFKGFAENFFLKFSNLPPPPSNSNGPPLIATIVIVHQLGGYDVTCKSEILLYTFVAVSI